MGLRLLLYNVLISIFLILQIKKVTEEMIADMDAYVNHLVTEIGFSCIHRRQKKYIVPNVNEKLDTWLLLHQGYEKFKNESIEVRKMAYKTFYRYFQYLIYFYFQVHFLLSLETYL